MASSGVLLRGSTILVPEKFRKRVIELAHIGHQGRVKTKALIRSRVWFPSIDTRVEQIIGKCAICQANEGKQHFEPLRPSDMPGGPWEHVDGDFFGPLDNGRHWFVNFCEHSRWATVHEISATSSGCVEPVLEDIFSTFGVLLIYKTDNGSPFQSARFGEFMKRWGCVHRRITPYWPRANPQVERFMKSMGKVLVTAKNTGLSREKALQEFLRVYRETRHSTTRVAPATLMFGRQSRTSGIPIADTFSHKKAEDTLMVIPSKCSRNVDRISLTTFSSPSFNCQSRGRPSIFFNGSSNALKTSWKTFSGSSSTQTLKSSTYGF